MSTPKHSSTFMSRTIAGFDSQLFHRTRQHVDEESQTATSRRLWFSSRGHPNPRSNLSRVVPTMEGVKVRTSTSKKMGTFDGVWVPTTLNVLSILMFLRFGFILGQAGVLGMLGLLVVSYIINLITTLSVSAISSNGTVRGGGAYYLISRSLGPEFGGSIGLVFYLGFVFNTGMNAVGLVDCIINNFGKDSGTMAQVFPEDFWIRYLYGTVVLMFCTLICLLGSAIFSRASNLLLAILLLATFSIPFSTLIRGPFSDSDLGVIYTGLSATTLRENLFPHFTKGAAGGTAQGKENWQNLFGILFPATAGIFAGASMSGDLKNPSKSIPSGTLNGLLFTFVIYSLVILSMGATISRPTLYSDLTVIQDINVSPHLILMGEFATSFFSALMGVIGSAKSLQALARDNVFPGLSIFGQGTVANDEPTVAILFTFLLSQLTLLADINTIANFVTMTYLITFWVTNMACFLLKIGSAPNFRPTFKFFTWWTAAIGAVISLATMFFVDGTYASGVVGFMLALFLIIHYTTPPKSWGDVSQSLIYHQVRKYLLRLRQEHVKFWRPQILLFVNDPRRSRKLIQFCNAMKKGGLYVVGHVIVTADFQESFPEAKRQQSSWMRYIDFTHIKAFPQVSISPTFEWGARNIVLSAGLGGMRPNIAVLGFYNLDEYRQSRPLIDVPSHSGIAGDAAAGKDPVDEQLPTDGMRSEKAVTLQSYVNILEDLLLCLQINVAVAKGFSSLQLPHDGLKGRKRYIDLWPIQMSAESPEGTLGPGTNVLTTNFDTYTLILQLGCILNTVPAWKKAYTIRVAVFVEFEADINDERDRVKKLLENLRIQAEVLVVWLADGNLHTYEVIVNGVNNSQDPDVDKVLEGESWWKELQQFRKSAHNLGISSQGSEITQIIAETPWPSSSYLQPGRSETRSTQDRLRKLLKRSKRRTSLSGLAKLGMPFSLNMRTHSLDPESMSENVGSESEVSTDDSSDEFSDSDAVKANAAADWNEYNLASTSDSGNVHGSGSGSKSGGSPHARTTATMPTIIADTDPQPGSASDTTVHVLQPPKNKRLLDAFGERPSLVSRPSTPHFSCKAIPDTQVLTDEGAGPSIRFADDTTASPTTHTIAQGHSADFKKPSLSFNDLPSRGQHLILNELFRRHSADTAVLFTTLPSPPPGTCKSERDSFDYLAELEILTASLPPVLLVHSNSLTVTTSL